MTKTHCMRDTPTYRTWRAMKSRCLNPKDPAYPRYGGRGITVCPEWLTFEGFLAGMGVRPEGTQLDREKNDLGYQPGNCRWVTPKVNNRNRRCTLRAADGTPLAELAERHGLHLDTLKWRLRHGVRLEVALSAPPDPSNRLPRS